MTLKLWRGSAALGAGVGALIVKASMAGAQGEAPQVTPPSPGPSAGGETLPGAGLAESVVSWVWWLAMLAVVVGLVAAGAAYGFFYWTNRSREASTALKVVVGMVVGGIVVGGAGVLANTLFGIGYRAF